MNLSERSLLLAAFGDAVYGLALLVVLVLRLGVVVLGFPAG